jgi:hypothetical protein
LDRRYRNLRDLARENYNQNPNLRKLYPTFSDFENTFFPQNNLTEREV